MSLVHVMFRRGIDGQCSRNSVIVVNKKTHKLEQRTRCDLSHVAFATKKICVKAVVSFQQRLKKSLQFWLTYLISLFFWISRRASWRQGLMQQEDGTVASVHSTTIHLWPGVQFVNEDIVHLRWGHLGAVWEVEINIINLVKFMNKLRKCLHTTRMKTAAISTYSYYTSSDWSPPAPPAPVLGDKLFIGGG